MANVAWGGACESSESESESEASEESSDSGLVLVTSIRLFAARSRHLSRIGEIVKILVYGLAAASIIVHICVEDAFAPEDGRSAWFQKGTKIGTYSSANRQFEFRWNMFNWVKVRGRGSETKPMLQTDKRLKIWSYAMTLPRAKVNEHLIRGGDHDIPPVSIGIGSATAPFMIQNHTKERKKRTRVGLFLEEKATVDESGRKYMRESRTLDIVGTRLSVRV
ncbi:hypothetical protein DFH07DRAFT_779216 [Mycena maculata]|uniref:Uncharacterized protein n=1 Tax=Mycena maculata TaxID=230809 RepID=A0AAD7I928_9AGAR|nr:hypothetical protein DFH07DRAFT_779216 [Mycena maculata]